MWHLPMLSYHPANFDGHRYCKSADIGFFHLSRDHEIERYRDFEGKVSPLQVTTLSISVPIGIAEEQIQSFTSCHVTTWSKGHITWWMLSLTLSPPFVRKMFYFQSQCQFEFQFYKLPTFNLNHVHLSPAPFVNPYKIKTRFQFQV